MGLNIGGKIEKINGKELSYEQFVERYLKKNQPILLTGLMDGWKACDDWVNENGEPNLHFFSAHFGDSKVQEYPTYVPYTTPTFFLDDWLNLYLDSHHMHSDPNLHNEKAEINCSDYRFVYMGAKGTWTPLHADVFRSYSWSANVCGKKQWHFLSPSQWHLLFDRNMKSSVYDIFDDVSETQFPGFKKAIWLECTQEQNEIIFVPSGWYHQVHNQEDTISINHNWFNAYNLSWVWNLLLKDYKEAKEYIDDIRDICDDFEGLCQRNLAANTGMNFFDFFIFITLFSFANLTQLHHLCKGHENPILVSSGKVRHLITNLISIRKVALNMKSFEAFTVENLSSFLVENCSPLSDIRKFLEESKFIELCVALNRTYGMIDDQRKQSSEVKDTSTSICTKDCLLLNYLKPDFGYLDFSEACGSKVSGPKDLIRIIDYTFAKLSGMGNDWSTDLLTELNQHEMSVL
ncbi:2-oxoglutarate (2OG) and Fe(II)-dependent oxygenase superfamily protein isoform X2 [Tasmannia lanceolata]|uniref:2-oxoglutarate (2OG) and Fe(II)-dependent oxygenase superfamily protein isoform X2 n=1 Tax=Tasmannia lanceolata TaxID=3420 RepID=UPI0040631E65